MYSECKDSKQVVEAQNNYIETQKEVGDLWCVFFFPQEFLIFCALSLTTFPETLCTIWDGKWEALG